MPRTTPARAAAGRSSGGGSRRPASDRGVAAADADRLAGDPPREVGGEEGHERRDVLRLAEAPDRIEREDPLTVLGDEFLVAVRGLDPAERERAHGDRKSTRLNSSH